MRHEMQMRFGIETDRNLQTAIHELAPRILRVVKESSNKIFSPSLIEPTNERLNGKYLNTKSLKTLKQYSASDVR